MDIRITETFTSIQGEGLRVGAPSFFIRTFGCNLSCPGFGQPDLDNLIPIEEMPHNRFDASQIKSIDELPVFSFGCDSSAAWSKKYVHLSQKKTPQELVANYIHARDNEGAAEIVITGGEPLLRRAQKFWVEFITELTHRVHVIDFPITFETNGTQELIEELGGVLDPIDTIFSVSPKLSNSGEPRSKAWNTDAIKSYVEFCNRSFNSRIYLKFVIRNEEQIHEIHEFLDALPYSFRYDQIYLMPEGGTIEGLSLTEREVANIAIKHGFMYSPRLHINLYGNSWGT